MGKSIRRTATMSITETWAVTWADDGAPLPEESSAQNPNLIRRSKKMKPRLLIAALLAVIVMTMASTVFAAPAAKATPFKGSWDSTEIPTFAPAPPPDATLMFVDGKATGNATLLGKYTAEFEATVDLACGCSQGDSVHLVAANGDSLYGLGQGVGVPDKPGFNLVTQTYTIMGGTGRFAGATGAFVVVRLADNATGVSSGLLTGTIVLR
jgi:hypothetical protein